MQKQIVLDRRSFIKTTSTASGGLILGFSIFTGCADPSTAVLQNKWFDVNAYIKIANTGKVTIFSPNPEVGQGVKTAMPMIVAEELDVDWKDVVVEQAGLKKNVYKRQMAGGSQSIRSSWDALRIAGAAARHILVKAAAKKWEVPFEEITTKSGIIFHEKSNKKMGYGEIASGAAEIEIPDKIDLKPASGYKIIGQPFKNVDNHKIITGQALFGIDFEREGMKIAMIERPPAFGQK